MKLPLPKLREWVKLPSEWIESRGLKSFQWKTDGSTNTAALMLLIGIAHHASEEQGLARLSYDQLEQITHLSRTKIADGLQCLDTKKLIIREPAGQSTYQLANYDPRRGWVMLPARDLYTSGGIRGFKDFHLRKPGELDALKAYLAFAARRDRAFNAAFITREQLHEYTGIPDGRITTALSILAIAGLIATEQHPSRADPSRTAYAYRLTSLYPRIHQGTTGRAGGIPSDLLA